VQENVGSGSFETDWAQNRSGCVINPTNFDAVRQGERGGAATATPEARTIGLFSSEIIDFD
jgi:hypothetical protein